MKAKKRSKKKSIVALSVIIVLFIVLLCVLLIPNKFINLKTLHHGDVSNVQVIEKDSSLYSQDDIRSAMEIVKNDFEKDWKGCTLTEIRYAGDEESREESESRGSETMVLYSTIETDRNAKNSSMNSPYTYTDFKWILTKDDNGNWVHVDHGYA